MKGRGCVEYLSVEHNIKVGLKEMGVYGLDLFGTEWDSVLGS
jgi:hypothetical protein